MSVSHILFLAGGNGRNAISGAEHHVVTLLHELAARGVDTEFIVLLWATDPQIELTLARLRADGVRVTVIARKPGRHTLFSRLVRALDCWRRLSIALRDRRDRVIHMHMELVMQVLAARFAGCRQLVMTIHNDEPKYRRPHFRTWFRLLVASGMRFVAITDHVRKHLVEAVGMPGAAVQTIKYGVTAPPRAAVTRSMLGVSDDDFVVGFIGRLTAQKNVPLLIRAMAMRPNMSCVLVGDGELRAELEQLAASLECRNVTFLGARSGAAGLMPLFDVFCLPSMWEGLGVVLLEAMFQRVPVVASRAGAIPEVLDGGRCGLLVDPQSVDSLVNALDSLRADAARRHQLAREAQAFALSAYSVQRMGDQICSLYRELSVPVAVVREQAA